MSTVDGGDLVEFAGVQYPVGADDPFDRCLRHSLIARRTRHSSALEPHASLSTRLSWVLSPFSWYNGDLGLAVVPLVGSGTATLDVIASPFGDQLWELSSVRDDFATTPEPATVLLVGTGMFVLAPRRYRRRRRDLREYTAD